MRFEEIVAVHPRPTEVDREALLRCVRECLDCGASCTACADASLAEADVEEMIRCIRLCLDCADACHATGRSVVRQTEPDPASLRAMIAACAAACLACAEECERHASHHEHCRISAEECRECKAACDDLLAAMA
jgi:hypothetical protein